MLKPPYGEGTGMVFDNEFDAKTVAEALYGEGYAKEGVVSLPMMSMSGSIEETLMAFQALFEKPAGVSADGSDAVLCD